MYNIRQTSIIHKEKYCVRVNVTILMQATNFRMKQRYTLQYLIIDSERIVLATREICNRMQYAITRFVANAYSPTNR